ncbi:hypothetical protein HL667_14015 [Bradyrhizobium sp. 83012]|uniref:Uncharacterized protein n=1 Tax=Bradyrhizobium aeschynomenes TaxID=2734909 RepID=A0ABX2CFM4_9BRAD|nr:hypothetical protein [Bradyrhizobium aeschynomenes]NPU66114.1 hypothetical protein [Bradyrhizobium aeschynomenes]
MDHAQIEIGTVNSVHKTKKLTEAILNSFLHCHRIRSTRLSTRLQAMLACLLLCGCLVAGWTAESRADDLQARQLAQTDSYQAYTNQIIAVEKDFSGVFSPTVGLFLSGPSKPWLDMASFKRLQQLSVQHPDFAIRFIAEPDQQTVRRAIAVWPKLELSTEDYVSFLREMVDLRDRDLISSDDFAWAFRPFPPVAIICDYASPQLQSVLQRVLALGDLTPEFRSNLEDGLSGKSSRIWRRDDGGKCSVRR